MHHVRDTKKNKNQLQEGAAGEGRFVPARGRTTDAARLGLATTLFQNVRCTLTPDDPASSQQRTRPLRCQTFTSSDVVLVFLRHKW